MLNNTPAPHIQRGLAQTLSVVNIFLIFLAQIRLGSCASSVKIWKEVDKIRA
jgi:hypothetical protein